MNQIQVLGIVKKNKANIATGGAIQVPMLEIEYLSEQDRDNYKIERIRVILDNPSLVPWMYTSKGSLIYVLGRGVKINGELVISATSILLIRDHTGKSGTTLLFQYGTQMNQFFVSGDLKSQREILSDAIRVHGSLETYETVPIVNDGFLIKSNMPPSISTPPCLICGKPSSKGVVI